MGAMTMEELSETYGEEFDDDPGMWLDEGEDVPAGPSLTPEQHLLATQDAAGGKLTAANLDRTLTDLAHRWLTTMSPHERGQNHFLSSVHTKLRRYGSLTPAQSAGVLNTYAAKIRPRAPRVVELPGDDDDEHHALYVAWLHNRIGEGYYTVVVPGGPHITLRVTKWKQGRYGTDVRYWQYMDGTSNTSDYTTFGYQAPNKAIVVYTQYQGDGRIIHALDVLTGSGLADARKAYALMSKRCARCNKLLTNPDSIEDGLGSECRTKVA